MPNPHKRKMRKQLARKKKEAALAPSAPKKAVKTEKTVKKEKKSLLDSAVDVLKGKKE